MEDGSICGETHNVVKVGNAYYCMGKNHHKTGDAS